MQELKVHASSGIIERMVQRTETEKETFDARLADALTDKGVARHGAGRVLSDRFGVSSKAANKWLNGESLPRPEALGALSDFLGVRREWLQYGVGPKRNGDDELAHQRKPRGPQQVMAPYLKEAVSASGEPIVVIDTEKTEALERCKFHESYGQLEPENAVFWVVGDNRMAHLPGKGDVVGADRGSTQIEDGRLFLVEVRGQLRVQTLYRQPGGGVRMTSTNRSEYPDEEYSLADLRDGRVVIIGQVFSVYVRK